MSEANRVFHEEVREKKTTASGVHGKKGKKGRVGKMITPADLSGREYRKARELPSFNVYDFLHKLHESPALKSVLLSRMDEEYRNYRLATEKTLDAVAEIIKISIDPLYQEINELRSIVEEYLQNATSVTNDDFNPRMEAPENVIVKDRSGRVARGKRRIKWGNSPEIIRQTVYQELLKLEEAGYDVSTETIKQHCPSMLRWIYGEKALFDGIEGLRNDFGSFKSNDSLIQTQLA